VAEGTNDFNQLNVTAGAAGTTVRGFRKLDLPSFTGPGGAFWVARPSIYAEVERQIMNRWSSLTKRVALGAILAGSLAAAGVLTPATVAWAQSEAPDGAPAASHSRGPRGLVGMAEQLGSLSDAQRATIQRIAQAQRSSFAPVRQADAAVLDVLARQVEAGAIDRQALDGSVRARESAALAARGAHRDAMQKLHDVLTTDQRNQLVDASLARMHGHFPRGGADGGAMHDGGGRALAAFGRHLGLTDAQKEQIRTNFRAERAAEGAAGQGHPQSGAGKAWLDSFRTDGFQAGAMGPDAAGAQAFLDRRADRLEDWMQAAVPVLTQSQRATLAGHLRDRAKRELGS
jgi:Spy/CpxP family protein refolding chaperone